MDLISQVARVERRLRGLGKSAQKLKLVTALIEVGLNSNFLADQGIFLLPAVAELYVAECWRIYAQLTQRGDFATMVTELWRPGEMQTPTAENTQLHTNTIYYWYCLKASHSPLTRFLQV